MLHQIMSSFVAVSVVILMRIFVMELPSLKMEGPRVVSC